MAKNGKSDLVLDIISLQTNIQKRIGGALSFHGIGLSEYLVLAQLFAAPDLKMRRVDLAERVGLTPSGITRLLNPMEKTGLIRKENNPRDARVSFVMLSKAGKRIYEESQVTFGHTASKLLEPLDARQLKVFSDLVTVIK